MNFIPKKMTQEELYYGIRKIAREYFKYRNIVKRCFRAFKGNGVKDFYHFVIRVGENFSSRWYYLHDKLSDSSAKF